mmetsp:Transcript_4125/g.10622  ORF Transcript_4125/g.10622 Transcript_4125/m.10622 type:complete len:557 (+) Transcript_4125:74-1744(+)
MGGASSFIAMLCIAGFLTAAWLATKISKAAGVSSIVLEITTGVVLGPSVLGLISPEYATCQAKRHYDCTEPADLQARIDENADSALGETFAQIANMDLCHREDYLHDAHGDDHSTNGNSTVEHNESHSDTDSLHDAAQSAGHRRLQRRRLAGSGSYHSYGECLVEECKHYVSNDCSLSPDFFTLIGHTGVAMMIFESGMHFDFGKALIVGPKACVVAVFGTILPLITGAALTMLYGKPLLPDAISVGTALAPTSVGIALRLLGEAGVLQENFGQAIITAAFVDDILSLVLFNVLFSLRGDFQFVPVVIYPIIGVAFMGVAMVLAVKFWPWFITQKLLPAIPNKNENAKISSADEGLFLVMMVLLVGYSTATHYLGTHLWGCFIAGMSFACLTPPHHAHHVWVKQTKRATGWMIRIFFACTVAFSIPIGKLLSFEAFWKGSLMGIGPCVLTKVLCAPFMGDARFVIGWAMVGRAEFAYLIAQMAAAGDMISPDMFSVVIWALLYATILAPFVFRTVLKKYIQRHPEMMDKAKAASDGTNAEDAVDAADHGTMSAAGV